MEQASFAGELEESAQVPFARPQYDEEPLIPDSLLQRIEAPDDPGTGTIERNTKVQFAVAYHEVWDPLEVKRQVREVAAVERHRIVGTEPLAQHLDHRKSGEVRRDGRRDRDCRTLKG